MFSWLVDTAHAMGAQGTAGGEQPNALVQFLPMFAIFAIFYFLLIRPQQKKAKEHKAMIEAVQRGDDIVTSGGIMGKVTGVTDDVVTVEIAEKVKIRVQKAAIANVVK